jgi:predicted ATPase/DNA-binding SARP family transcriptional activator
VIWKAGAVRVALLGPTAVEADDGTPVDIGGARVRMLLARLALDPDRPVPPTTLIDDLWGEQPPADASNALQSLVSRLRKVCPDVTLEPGGYRLAVAREDVDVFRFDRLRAAGRLDEALALWRGDALSDVREAPFAAAAVVRLDEARLAAEEERFATGELDVAALTAMHEKHPLRERTAGLLMRALCAQGRQSDALRVYEEVRGRLADELGVDPSQELQDVHLAALRGELKPRTAVDRLPVRLTSFVGRDEELAQITAQLGQARLVTLVGPGGAGKTRLATETAARHPLHAKGRVWFAALAGVRAQEDLAGAVLSAFDVTFVGEPLRRRAEGVDRIAEVLGAGESLLVLDNCEHVITAAAEFAAGLLRRVPNLRIVATSREPLAIDGESLCPVGPLAVPNGQTDIAGFGAVRLFLDRATAVRPGFELDESTVDDVKQICRRLDGMPLALELAAARLRSMTIRQITQRLDDRFRLLTSGSRTALPRQRTLRAVVEWSWDLLNGEERQLARRLSVFPAGADLAAIEHVCHDDALYVLTSLVEKSIVDVFELEGEPRYRMLETIRVFADEQLDASGEKSEVLGRFRRYYRDLTVTWEPLTRTARQLEAIAMFEAEQDNIVAALRGAVDDRDVELAADLLGGAFWYWLVKGDNERAQLSVREVLALGDELPLPDDLSATFRAMELIMTAIPNLPETELAATVIEDCVRTGATSKYPSLAIALPMLAFLSQNPELARREVARAAASDDAWARAAADWALSFILVDEGDLEAAEVARDKAYDQFMAVGDRWGSAMTLGMKAAFVSQTGDNEGAIALYRKGLAAAQELRSADDAVQQRWRLAVEYARFGDHESAAREVAEAEKYVNGIGNDQLSIMIGYAKAEIWLRSGRLAEARAQSVRLKQSAGTSTMLTPFVREWSANLDGRIAVAEGRPDEAEAGVAIAIETTSDRGDMPDLASVTELLAIVRHQQGRDEVAARMLALARRIRGRLDLGDPDVRRLVAEIGEPEPLSLTKAEAVREIRAEAGIGSD